MDVKLSYPGPLDGYEGLGVAVGTNHLQDIVDIIYAARLQGAEGLELSVDDPHVWNLLLKHYYLFKHLPETHVTLDVAGPEVAVLHVRFVPRTMTMEEELASMTDEDVDRMFAQIEFEDDHPDFGGMSVSVLQDRFHAVRLPE